MNDNVSGTRALRDIAAKRVTEPPMPFCINCLTVPTPHVAAHSALHFVSLNVYLSDVSSIYSSMTPVAVLKLAIIVEGL